MLAQHARGCHTRAGSWGNRMTQAHDLDTVPLGRLLSDIGVAADPVTFAPGQSLFRAGEASEGLYMILDGVVQLHGRTPGDGMVDLGRVGAGGVIGEFSLLDPGPRSASAIAAGPVTARRVGLARFDALRVSGHPAALAVMDRLRLEVARRTRAVIGAITAALVSQSPAGRAIGVLPPPLPGPAGDMAALLSRFPGFDQLDPADWAACADAAQRLDAPRGTRIADTGAPGDALVIVARGAVRGAVLRDGVADQLLVHGPGSVAGPTALMDGGPRPLTLDVREDAVLFLVPAPAFARLRSGDTRLGRILMRQIGLQMVRDMRRLSRVLGRLQPVPQPPEGMA